MIAYELYLAIGHALDQGLSIREVARKLGVHRKTVRKYRAQGGYLARQKPRKSRSLLDAHKPLIQAWLEKHPYSAQQLFQRLRADHGYAGGYTIIKDYVRLIRPAHKPAFLSLAFEPAEAAQIDWGSAGLIRIGSTQRKLHFFVMTLCHSRLMYLEFTCAMSMEIFLHCHQRALEYFGGSPRIVICDNMKTAVVEHRHGQPPRFNQRYLDFAAVYGFEPRACAVRKPNEKGQVESNVGYIKKNLLAGLELPCGLEAMNLAAMNWLTNTANVRNHNVTKRKPREFFEEKERAGLIALPPHQPDTSVVHSVRSNSQFRVRWETNLYSVPARYASSRLVLHLFADRLCFYHETNLIARHPRSYDRHQKIEDPDHDRELVAQRQAARNSRWLAVFLQLHPKSEEFLARLREKQLNARVHVNKIVALVEIYGRDAVVQGLTTALELSAYNAQFVENLIQQRQRARATPTPGPLHVTRGADLLEIDLPEPDLSIY
jgi:transposase